MAYGVKSLKYIQWGAETTAGTTRAATAIWRGEGTMTDDSPIEFVPEDVGFLQDQGRTYMPRVGVVVELDETPATFEQFPYLLAMGVDSALAGVLDTGGSGYLYAGTLATNAVKAPKTYTVEVGDNAQEYESPHFFCEEFNLSGAKNEAVMMSATLRGRQMVASTKTSLTLAAVDEVIFNKGKLYIDTTTVGTTQVVGTWLGFSLKVPTGFQPVYTGDGALYFSAIKQASLRDVTGELILEHDATGMAELLLAQAETTRLVRMIFEGPALTTSGAAYTYKTLKIDLAIKYTGVPSLEDDDGDDVLTFPFKMVYSTQGGVITCVNSLSALT